MPISSDPDPAVQHRRSGAGAGGSVRWRTEWCADRSAAGRTHLRRPDRVHARGRARGRAGPVDRSRMVAGAMRSAVAAATLGTSAVELGGVVVTLLVSSFLVFSSLYVAPGDPIDFLVQGRSPSPEAIAAVSRRSRPRPAVPRAVLALAGRVLHGDLGQSFQFRDDVSTLIAARLGTTILLMVMSATLIAVFGLTAGIVGALQRRGGSPTGRCWYDHGARRGAVVRRRDPADVGVRRPARLVPDLRGRRRAAGPDIPPGAAGVRPVADVRRSAGRVTRSAMLDELGREHVEVALSRGVPRRTVVRRHVLRNSLGPISRSPACWSPGCWSAARSSRRRSASVASARCWCSRSTSGTSRWCRRSC